MAFLLHHAYKVSETRQDDLTQLSFSNFGQKNSNFHIDKDIY